MSKAKRKTDQNAHTQESIFDYLQKVQRETILDDTEGSFRCIDPLRASLRSAIKECAQSVPQIAGEMSHLTGDTITKDLIYSWTRDTNNNGGPNRRHIPAEYLPAFCYVTGCNEPLMILGKLTGLFVLPGPEALRSEIARQEAKAKQLTAAVKRRKLMLKEMEQHAK